MDLKTELLEFIEANNYFNLGGLSNAEGCVDAYLQAYSKQLMQTDVVTSVYECKVCGKPYGDNLSLYEHYDCEHNQETE